LACEALSTVVRKQRLFAVLMSLTVSFCTLAQESPFGSVTQSDGYVVTVSHVN